MLLQEPSWLLLSFYLIHFFFMKITFKFSCSGMFQDVSACSGMFRNVLECSMFRGFTDALFIPGSAVSAYVTGKRWFLPYVNMNR